MTRTHQLSVALLPTSLTAAMLAATPAEASSRTVSDPSGDAVRALDITSVRYSNNDTSVAYVWDLRKVAKTTRLVGTTLDTCGGLCSDYY
jgi:hypothetical protein